MSTPPPRPVAGLVLAAGYSSRMEKFKPLLSLGGRLVIQRVIETLRQGGIEDVTVVVGHRASDIVPIIEELGAKTVLNPDFASGMYSSVKAGIGAIADRCDGCLLLPVDVPLVRPATIERLLHTQANSRPPVLYPVFRNRRGHPPYISSRLFPEILSSDGTGGLCSILARHAAEAAKVAVYDEGVHWDMDTPADYAVVSTLARRDGVPSRAECEAILADLQPRPEVITHSRKVAEVALALATRLKEAGVAMDGNLVQAGALLHDVAKGYPRHPEVGGRWVAELGFPIVATVVASHSDLDFLPTVPDERAIVYLADKMVQGDRLVTLEDRFQRSTSRFIGNGAALEAAEARYATAKWIALAAEQHIGESLTQVLSVRDGQVIAATESVCPVCLQAIPAHRVVEGDDVFLRKTCPEHGAFKTVIWRGASTYQAWGGAQPPAVRPANPSAGKARGCPYDCGLCAEHRQQSCCVLVEVTKRCNLRCPVCFAGAGEGQDETDPSLDDLRASLQALKQSGRQVNIQLSGGEPTVRDDLPEIVSMVRGLGFDFVQVNTNGIRLARDKDYLTRLKEAGLDCVFLQFDGVTDEVYRAIRGRDLLDLKVHALDNCAEVGIGVVLVPVLVPGVNTGQIGDILRLAVDRSPVVRTVHFQPISYFGRYPGSPGDEERLTIPEILTAIEEQAGLKVSDFRPGTAENPYCSFNGEFTIAPNGKLTSAQAPKTSCCCSAKPSPPVGGDEADRARRFVAQRWAMSDALDRPSPEASPAVINTDSLDAFLESRKRTLCISGMAFQDAWTLDLERLRQCYIHIATNDRRLVPLCAFNLSGQNGETIHRGTC